MVMAATTFDQSDVAAAPVAVRAEPRQRVDKARVERLVWGYMLLLVRVEGLGLARL